LKNVALPRWIVIMKLNCVGINIFWNISQLFRSYVILILELVKIYVVMIWMSIMISCNMIFPYHVYKVFLVYFLYMLFFTHYCCLVGHSNFTWNFQMCFYFNWIDILFSCDANWVCNYSFLHHLIFYFWRLWCFFYDKLF